MAQPPNQTAAPPRTVQAVRTQTIEMLTQRPTGGTTVSHEEPQENKNTNNNSSTTTTTNGTIITNLSLITNSTPLNNIVFNTHANWINIKQAVKKVLFPKIKFLGSKDNLEYSMETNLIAQIILTSLNLPESHNTQNVCWVQVCHLIADYLNLKQTSVVHAIKQKFNGTFMWCWQQFLDIN